MIKSVQLAPRDTIQSVIDSHGLVFPMLASPKIDGLRAARRGSLLTRSMKQHKNLHLQRLLGSDDRIEGFDGELVVGDPWSPDCFEKTDGPCRSINTTPDATLCVFDNFDIPGCEYWFRLETLQRKFTQLDNTSHLKLVEQKLVRSYEEMDEYEEEQLLLGYEGIMVRNPHGIYKGGRCTAKERNILKVKRFVDDEAVVIGWTELMHNENEAYVAENGMQKRSTKADGLVPSGTLGTFLVRNGAGQEFGVGTGFKAHQRVDFWENREQYIGKQLTYKHFPKGAKDAPRHGVFKAFRGPSDM